MPVLISYSHRDSGFAKRLAAQLVKHKARVWIDQWELHVGDSIIDRIQAAIQGATALLVILSEASVESEWCKKELSSGLLRELEERRVVVLPVLLEDCEIPLFLRDKLYADFRTDFDKGLRAVLEAIGRVTSEALGRVEEPQGHIDWAVDWGMIEDLYSIRVTVVEQAKDQPYSVLTEIRIIANDVGTQRYLRFVEADLDWIERVAIIDMLAEGTVAKELRIRLDDQMPKQRDLAMGDPKLGTRYHVVITSRRLGEDTGRDILLDLGGQLRGIREGQRQAIRKPTLEEQKRLKELQAALDQG